MDTYFPGQRWISETEPELGLGLVLDVTTRTVAVLYHASNETRHYAIGNAPLQRVRFEAVTDTQVTEALKMAMLTEGVIPALESAHGFAQAIKEAEKMRPDEVVLINMSGRGDKDIFTIADALGDEHWKQFIRQKAAEYGEE